MGLQTGIFAELIAEQNARLAEKRSSLENPQTPLSYPAEWLLDIFNGGRTDSGIRVSELTALQVVTFLSCVDLIGSALATLPFHVYERSFLQESKRPVHRIAYEHDIEDLISLEPNDEMSSFTLIKAHAIHFLAWGNGYIEIQRDGGNSAVALWPRNPAKTRPYRISQPVTLSPVPWRPFPVSLPAGTLVYKTTDAIDDEDRSENDASSSRSERIIPAADMLHVPGISLDGRIGQDIVWLARNVLGLALATEKFGNKYFANYARPGGMLIPPVATNSEQRTQARNSFREAQGGENMNSLAVAPGPGWDYKQVTNNPEEAQTLQTQQFVDRRICSLFHVPPHMVGQVDKGRANTEQLAQEFLTYTLGPPMAAIRLEFKRKLFPSPGIGRRARNQFFVDFDVNDLLRPDSASREKFYATMKQWGGMNTNDLLAAEKMNPVDEPWAEKYWMPVNMTLTDTPIDPTHQDGAGNGEVPPDPAKDTKDQKAKEGKSYSPGYSRLFRDAFGRILAREKADVREFTRVFGPVLWALVDGFEQEQRGKHGQETDRFVAEYIGAMQKRRADWQDTDECAAGELARAAKVIKIAVYRDCATQRALAEGSPTEEQA